MDDESRVTYRMEVGRAIPISNIEAVSTDRDSGSMQWLRDVACEVSDEF